MLNNNGSKKTCGFESEIVSYLYDEIGDADRGKFEKHLSDCGTCTDEFAAVSNARFSVFEWQKEEFAHLTTPQINIPYPEKREFIRDTVSTGSLSGLSYLWTILTGRVPVAAFVLAICVAAGFLAIKYTGGDNTEMAANTKTEEQILPAIVQPDAPADISSPESAAVGDNSDGDNIQTADNDDTASDVRPAKAVATVWRQTARKPVVAGNRKVDSDITAKDSVPQMKKAPILSNFEEVEDKSPRLSDLFDEVASNGSGKE